MTSYAFFSTAKTAINIPTDFVKPTQVNIQLPIYFERFSEPHVTDRELCINLKLFLIQFANDEMTE